MNRDVRIIVTGTQNDGGGNEIVTEYEASGQYFEKGGCRYLLYREQDPDSGAVTANTLKIKGNILELSRKGNIHSRMVFEAGRTHPSSYITVCGTLQLDVCTEDLKCLWTDNEVRVQITYSLLTTGGLLSRNKLDIRIESIRHG